MRPILIAAALTLAPPLMSVCSAGTQSPADFEQAYRAAASAADPSFAGFSAQRGEQFFKARHGGEWSCASCHTENPAAPGKHAKTGKSIAALSPAANPERFTEAQKVEKWFKRNCNDVLNRPCTAVEKGDVLAYLLSVKK